VELESTWKPSKRINFRLNVTAQNARNFSDIDLFYDKKIPGQAALAGYLRANVSLKSKWQLWGELSTLQDRFYDRGNLLKAANARTISVGSLWRYKNWRTQFTINNVTDQKIEDFNGFPRPGRTLHFGLSKNF